MIDISKIIKTKRNIKTLKASDIFLLLEQQLAYGKHLSNGVFFICYNSLMNTQQREPQKNPVGRPLKYKTVEELQEAIEEYFTYCDNKTKEIHSEKLGDMVVSDPQPYAMAGLAYAVGLSRQALMEYSHKDEFGDTLKEARNRIEADLERRMLHKDTFTAGIIFNAKNNFGWVDKTETDVTSKGESIKSDVPQEVVEKFTQFLKDSTKE